MKLPKYQLKAESRFTRFEFISEGTKGAIRKLIEFQATTDPEVYNLAFGDKDPSTGNMNDLAVTNNGDTEKVLATVIAALYVFFDNFPVAYVYATGSTNARTRLYRMGVTKFYEEIQKDLYLYGQVGDSYMEFESDKYRKKIMFPEKLEKANKMLKTAKLPPNKHRS